jgi:hypothetical protein
MAMRGDNFREDNVMDEKSIPTTQSGAQLRHRYLRALTLLVQQFKNHRRRLASSAIVLMLACLFLAPLAFARIVSNTIDPLATVTDHGRLVIATGPVTCTRGEQTFLRVTVTQRATGAVAEGRSRVVCTGNSQHWEVHAATQGKATFDEGPAVAVAIARTADRGEITDAHQWLVNITLVGE